MSSKFQDALRVSIVDSSEDSPQIADDEHASHWRWIGSGSGNGSAPVLRAAMSPLFRSASSPMTKDDEETAALLRQRRSMSPRPRAENVMEKIMNPYLDRDQIPTPAHKHQQQQTNKIMTPIFRDHPQAQQHPPHYVKSSAFDDEFHSVYVAKYPRGLRGVFVLFQSPLLLMAIGIFSASVGLFIDFWLAKISIYINLLSDWGFHYLLASSLFFASFSAIVVHCCCPQAAGSGLPFMKVAISGIDMSDYLSLRCVVTKIVGLVAAFAAGLSIGKEGPFIMIACGFANILMNLPFFQRINNDETKRLEMLACACAAGVAATFGSPFGGVLFGVEVTSHFYLVRTLPRSFFAAIVGALMVNFVTENTRYGLFGSSTMGITDAGKDIHSFTARDLLVFTFIGVSCGLGGALFNYCISMLVRLRDRFFSMPFMMGKFGERHMRWCIFWNGLEKRLLLVLTITFLSCFLEFYGDSAWFIRHGSPRRILAALFSKDKEPFTPDSEDRWRHQEHLKVEESEDTSVLLSRSLVTYLPLKYVLTLVSVILPIPAGLFTPTFVIGGIFGRLIGEAINAFDLLNTQYQPYEYAIIGAGAFSSGVTHAISTAVIIMEISHNDGLNLPVSVAILASYFTAKRFTENVYDVLIMKSQLPRLKKLPKAAYDIPAWEVMRDVQDMRYLTADSTYREAAHVLKTSPEPVFPIVDSHTNMFLLATVTRQQLTKAIEYCYHKMHRHQAATPMTGGIRTVQISSPNQGEESRSPAMREELSALLFRAVAPPPNGNSSLMTAGSYGTTPTMQTTGDSPFQFDLNLLDWPLHFAIRRGGKVMDWGTNEICTRTKLTVLVNPSPFQLMEMTPMRRVDLLFRMLKLNNTYITRSGRLMGGISRDRLMNFLATTTKYKVPGLCSAIANCLSAAVGRKEKEDSPDNQQRKAEYKILV